MSQITLREPIWKDLVAIAKRKRKTPQALAEMVLRDYFVRLANEELMQRSEQSAQRSRHTIAEIEAAIKARRRAKK